VNTRTVRSVLLAALLPAAAACLDFDAVEFGGVSVNDNNGLVTVDGVLLPHARWVPLDVPAGSGTLVLAAATREIRVATAGPGEPARLEVQLFSEAEGEGALALVEGELVASRTGTGRVLANGVRGTLPAGIRLALRCGVGVASVHAPHGLDGVEGECGTGDLELSGGPLGEVTIRSGTGATRLSGAQADKVRVLTGTGALHATGLTCDELEIEAGTGTVDLSGLACRRLDVETGTADVLLRDCRAGSTRITSGTGEVIQAGANELGAAQFQLGTGEARQEPGS
jgi:hypothetical protein